MYLFFLFAGFHLENLYHVSILSVFMRYPIRSITFLNSSSSCFGVQIMCPSARVNCQSLVRPRSSPDCSFLYSVAISAYFFGRSL